MRHETGWLADGLCSLRFLVARAAAFASLTAAGRKQLSKGVSSQALQPALTVGSYTPTAFGKWASIRNAATGSLRRPTDVRGDCLRACSVVEPRTLHLRQLILLVNESS